MQYKSFFFLGIGGIGMSAIARYFKAKGFDVAGYDRTRSELTKRMEGEGIDIHYKDDKELISKEYQDSKETLVVITPAIPQDNNELIYFKDKGFTIMKRAQVLGHITRNSRGLCVAGTHGKTTISNMTAHLLHSSKVGCNAFLGGIAKNFDTNLVLSDKTDLVVIEADEFDRSFHQLSPYMEVITAVDADHLDIYGTRSGVIKSFEYFTSLIKKGGCLIMKKGLDLTPQLQAGVKLYTYSSDNGGDFHAENIKIDNGEIFFDFITPSETIKNIQLGVPVYINIENAVAAMALAFLNGATPEELRKGMYSFKGTNRRFEFHLKTPTISVIDDYAHHPNELKASIKSVKALFPNKKVCGIFQPHLYTRTRDLCDDFAKALSGLDEVILLDIYPAREAPIDGVSSKIIYDKITITQKTMCDKKDLLEELPKHNFDVLMTLGAGDIDKLIPKIVEQLKNNKFA